MPYLGDLTIVARRATPTEATMLKGMLEAAGIPATVADANYVQANSWMTNAVGGVRVLVPAALVETALATIAEFEVGAFELPDDDGDEVRREPQATDLALWGADISAFWSFWLTPVFGAAVHYLNSRTLGLKERSAAAWLLVSCLVTMYALYTMLSGHWELARTFQAGPMLSVFTLVWYFFAGHGQSRYIAETYGSRYVKRPLLPLWLGAVVFLLLLGGLGGFV
jgi:hypothetical protein